MTDEVNCKLIDLVHSKPCIYDKTDVYYSNKEHVKLMWQDIANSMQLPVPVCQKRWRYLRDYFVRQLHMTQNDEKKSYWALYDRMLFLKPFSTTRKIRLSINDNNNQRNSRKRNQSTKSLNNIKNIIESQQQYYNDQNSTTPILSISSGGNSGDEFNSFDYLNLYQAQFGLADDIALKQKLNEEQKKDDHKQLQAFYQQQNKIFDKEKDELKNYGIDQIPCRNPANEPQILLEELNNQKNSNENNNNNNINFNKNYMNENLINNNNIEDVNNYIYPNLPILLEKPDNEISISSSQDYLLDETKNIFEKYETNSIFDDDFNVPLMIPSRKRKRTDLIEEMLSIVRNEPDDHEYFFKSLLPNVRKIDDDLIMSFRSEIIQLCIKYKYMSQQQNCDSTPSSNINNNNNNNDYDGENSELIVIDTGEIDWRKKLKNRF